MKRHSLTWYEQSFSQDYLAVYKHRDRQDPVADVQNMLRWLRLPEGARVFDLCCGMGRHAMALAECGFQVTGMDMSKTMLTEAKREDREGLVTWLKGDVRRIPVRRKFDAVINLFTSFGYFSEDTENMKVLQQISRILHENGQFVIDFLNPDYLARNLVPESERTEGEVRICEKRSIQYGFVVKQVVICEPERPERTYTDRIKLYKLQDFKRMLSEACLVIKQEYGSYGGDPYDEGESPRLIIVGGKQPRPVNMTGSGRSPY